MLTGRRIAAAVFLCGLLAVVATAAAAHHTRAARRAAVPHSSAAESRRATLRLLAGAPRVCSVSGAACVSGCAVPVAARRSGPASPTAPCANVSASRPCLVPATLVVRPPESSGSQAGCPPALFERLRRGERPGRR